MTLNLWRDISQGSKSYFENLNKERAKNQNSDMQIWTWNRIPAVLYSLTLTQQTLHGGLLLFLNPGGLTD